MYKYFVLLALAVLILGLTFVAVHWRRGIYKTFSQHVAFQKSSTYFYFVLFLIVLPLLYLFFAKYLVPALNLSDSVLFLVALSCITQLGCTLVPETGGVKKKTHQTLAGVSALLLIPVLFCILGGDAVSGAVRIVVSVCIFLMVLIVGIVAFWGRARLPVLLLQIGYFALFFAAILAATY